MIEHGFTVADICDLADTYASDVEDKSDYPFQEFLEEQGLGNGALWPCYDEFMDCEYTCPDAIIPLLVPGTGELEEYSKDLVAVVSAE